VKDSWEATITTDSSVGGSFVNYPETFTYHKSGTVCYKGKISHFLPSYKEEGTEEIKEVIYRKFVGDVNVGRKGVRI